MADDKGEKKPNGAPYKIVPKGDKFQVVNNMGEVKGTHDSRADALKHQAALYTNVPGAAKVAEKKEWTGKAKRRTSAMVDAYVEQAKMFAPTKRDAMAKSGKAMKDGSFPIENAGDLRNAIMAFGRASDKTAAKAHIISRAKALGLESKLPDGWKK